MSTTRVSEILVTLKDLSREELKELKGEIIELWKELEYLEYLKEVEISRKEKIQLN